MERRIPQNVTGLRAGAKCGEKTKLGGHGNLPWHRGAVWGKEILA